MHGSKQIRALLGSFAVSEASLDLYEIALLHSMNKSNKDVAKVLFERIAVEELKTTRANPYPGPKVRSATNGTR